MRHVYGVGCDSLVLVLYVTGSADSPRRAAFFRVPYRCLCAILLAAVRFEHFYSRFNTAVPLHCTQGSSIPLLPFDTKRLRIFRQASDAVLVPAANSRSRPFTAAISPNMKHFGIRPGDMRTTKPAMLSILFSTTSRCLGVISPRESWYYTTWSMRSCLRCPRQRLNGAWWPVRSEVWWAL